MKKFGAFLLGAISGGIVGSLLALLLTPYSGAELQNRLVKYGDQVKNEIELAATQRRSELEQELERLRSGGTPSNPAQ